jgi:hypothetical protein
VQAALDGRPAVALQGNRLTLTGADGRGLIYRAES